MSYLDHIHRCNSYDARRFKPLTIAGKQVGLARDDVVHCLADHSRDFEIDDRGIVLKSHFADRDSRTQALTNAALLLVAQGIVRKIRHENYPVLTEWGGDPLALIDRGAVPAFGIAAFGVHINGFVRDGKKLRLWIGRRALDKMTDPGKLDNMVAGGQPFGLSLAENLVKESDEEAGISPELAARSIPVGRIRYRMEADNGLRSDTLFLYDLEMPPGIIPKNNDGEISSFALMDVEEVAELVRTTGEFKFNVNLVIIDFLIRHKIIDRRNEPDFEQIEAGIKRA